MPTHDLIIEGGTVIDGTGAAARRADIAIDGDRIAAVGDLSGQAARQRRSARGLIVAPGFIDVHTHDDVLVMQTVAGFHPKLSQGVTTVITGNCGISAAPAVKAPAPAPLNLLGDYAWPYPRFRDYLDAVDASAPTVNAACLVGHTTLRVRHVAQLAREADATECARMAEDLAEALAAGAIGLSTGLYYPPARAATAREVIALGEPLRQASGLVTMHLRDEGSAITAALDEAFEIGKALQVRTVISHHKVMGIPNHGRSQETLLQIEQAARRQPVCMDCYPYTASSTMLLPERISQSSDVLITFSGADPSAAGQSIFALARARGLTPEELARQLQPAGAIYFSMSEEDVSRILMHPLTMVGSDGLAHDVNPHPRLWGSFPRVLGHYVRERRLLSLERAIYKMTGLSAGRFGLTRRGALAPGCFADVVLFDAATVADRADFQDATRPSVGIEAVYVNGRLACEQGRTVEAHAGRLLRHGTG